MQEYLFLSRRFRNSLTQGPISATKCLQKPLPEVHHDIYSVQTSSASYESLLTHRVPSPSLYDNEEMSELWSRLSYSTLTDQYSHTEPPLRDSLQTIEEFSDWITQQVNNHHESLLPPPPELRRTRVPVTAVECPLSTSSQSSTIQPSPPISKRSATPTLLDQLSSGLGDLKFDYHIRSLSSTRPITPVPSLSHSCSFSSTIAEIPYTASYCSKPSDITCHIDMDATCRPSPLKTSKHRPDKLHTEAGTRNISPPMSSPLFDNTSFGESLSQVRTNDSDVDPTYQPFRTAPSAPKPVKEVSCIDWDESDDEHSHITRMKKSLSELRAAGAGRLRSDGSAQRQARTPKKTNVIESFKRTRASNLQLDTATLPQEHPKRCTSVPLSYAIIPTPQAHTHGRTGHHVSIRSPTKLAKKTSTTSPRKRAASATSMAGSVKSTISSRGVVGANAAPLLTSSLTSAKKRRLSVATSGKSTGGKQMSMGWVKGWMNIIKCS